VGGRIGEGMDARRLSHPAVIAGRLVSWLNGLSCLWSLGEVLLVGVLDRRNGLSAYGSRKVPSLGAGRYGGGARWKRSVIGEGGQGVVGKLDGERTSKVATDDIFARQRSSWRAGGLVWR
jgi:hypothetical protein